MKVFDQTLINEMAKGSVCRFNLAKLHTYCFSNCPQELVFNGDTYIPYGMLLSGFRASDVSPLSGGAIQLPDADEAMSALVLNKTLQGKPGYVWEAYYNAATMVLIGADLLAAGTVAGRGSTKPGWATFEISPLNPNTQQYPRTRISKKRYPRMPAIGTKFTAGNVIVEVK